MRAFLIALSLLPLGQASSPPAGDPQAGKTLWESGEIECRDCHGPKGEGAFGPDLAGRKLTVAQFTHAVRQPWGVMPTFFPWQISDRELADLHAYFGSLPSVAQPGPWRMLVPAGASRGMEAATTAGCVQCHGFNFGVGRRAIGAVNADFEWFKQLVYAHAIAYPRHAALIGEEPKKRLAMGNFSRSRLAEPVLQDIWNYLRDMGVRAPMEGQFSAGVPSPQGVTYTLTVKNYGVPGTGLTAEGITVTAIVPTGATVVSATGDGYQGVRRDEQAKATVAEWRVPRMGPRDRQTYTLTLSQAGTATDNVRGRLRWEKPAVKTGPDSEAIAPAPLAPIR